MPQKLLFISLLINITLVILVVVLVHHYKVIPKIHRIVFLEKRVPVLTPDFERNRNFKPRIELFEHYKNSGSNQTLILGDSHTAWVSWSEFTGNPMILGRGIDGDTVAGINARLESAIHPGINRVVIWIGTNDILQGRSSQWVVDGIDTAVKRLKEARIQTAVVSVPPLASWVTHAELLNERIADINREMGATAMKHGFYFVYMTAVWSNKGRYLHDSMTWDGVHLSASAYKPLVERLMQWVNSADADDES